MPHEIMRIYEKEKKREKEQANYNVYRMRNLVIGVCHPWRQIANVNFTFLVGQAIVEWQTDEIH